MKTIRKSSEELVGKQGPYSIKVKVIEKTSYRHSLGGQALDYQIFKLKDEEGSILQAILYQEDLEVFQDILEDNMTYEISNAKVKMIPGQEWENLDDEIYEIQFSSDTFVLPILEPEPPVRYDYIFLASIPRKIKLNDRCDVLGVVIYVDTACKVSRRNGQPGNICEVIIVDQSYELIMIVTTWENLSLEQCNALYSIAVTFPVVSFSTLSPSYRRGFSLSTTHSTYIGVHPKGEEVDALRGWAHENKNLLAAKTQHIFEVRQPEITRTITTIEMLLQKKVMNALQEEKRWLCVELPEFRRSDVHLYLGCSNCGTGTYEDIEASYTYYSCVKEDVISSPRMNFTFVTADGTGTYYFTAVTENAEKLLDINVAELYSMLPQKKEDYLSQIERQLNTSAVYIQVVLTKSLSRTQVLS